MDSVIEKFTNNTYKILKQIYDCQVPLQDGSLYIPISQAELARIVGVSTITMNKYFKEFQEDGLVQPYENKRGKYKLSDKALIVIRNIENMQDELKEVE